MFRGMTVAEMDAIDLYSVIMTALVLFSLASLGIREFRRGSLDRMAHKIIFLVGIFAMCGLPVVLFLFNVAKLG